MKVAKFGGSSLASADQISKVTEIVKADPDRTCIVVSAPGKRFPEDHKITDLLYEWHRLQSLRLSTEEVRTLIYQRFAEMCDELFFDYRMLDEDFARIQQDIEEGASADYAASRGEYLSAKLVAKVLGFSFVEAADYITFYQGDSLATVQDTIKELKETRFVFPGFYGVTEFGDIKTFSRGGSDLTGALLAEVLGASVYENWTDVSGMLMADPRIVDSPLPIEKLSYRELRELSYMGASVFHEEATFPVKRAGIPTNIRNTNVPDDSGTLIVPESSEELAPAIVTGVAGRKGFAVLKVEKAMMNQEVGFVRRLLSVLESRGISFEHVPSGIDSVSVVIDQEVLDRDIDTLMLDIKTSCQADSVEVERDLALVAVVGRRMAHTVGVAAKVSAALAQAGVNLRMINQGSSEINIIIGIDEADFETAIRSIYQAFIGS
jgi:aspartate kinase